jgi:hypothetical protein
MRLYLPVGDRSALLAHWAPRIGQRAAMAYVRARFCAASWPTLGFAFFVTYVVGRDNSMLGLVVLAFLILGVAAISVFYGFYSQWLAWHLASRVLGTRVTMFKPPPGPEADYERWCADRGVIPHRGDRLRDRIPRHDPE